MARILIAEDDPKTRATVALYLRADGHEILCAEDGARAIELATAELPDLVLLDLMLPRVHGHDVCRHLRATVDPAIIMVTARSTEDDKVAGLELGADDYITKPFSPRELRARVRALLRRTAADSIEFAGIAIDRASREVRVGGELIALTPTEYRLLHAFVRAAGRTLSRHELITRALGDDYDGLDRTVDVHIKNLRKKLGGAGRSIATVFGVGYRLAK